MPAPVETLGDDRSRRPVLWLFGAGVVAVVLIWAWAKLPTPAQRVGVQFAGYRLGTNGYRVAQFAVANSNRFPVRCRFWVTPPNSVDYRSQALFDPEYKVIAARSVFRLEGAARPRNALAHYPALPGTNLPSGPWVLRANVWDARPPGTAVRMRDAVQHFLGKVGLSPVGNLLSRRGPYFTSSGIIPSDGQTSLEDRSGPSPPRNREGDGVPLP
ncbi:MAG: hypothetical protein HZA90_14125 [Verrucomicrobia bacterium]|nr:hypothetical protein [Verrucomicrobiota bacterium]